MANKKWIVVLLELDESALPIPLGKVPNLLHSAVSGMFEHSALVLDTVFLLEPQQKRVVEAVLEQESLEFHNYVVEERGERCIEETCVKHDSECEVINLNDKRPRREDIDQDSPA